MMLGYTFLTYTVTCNNHGRNVHLYYERELSLVLKGIITDFAMDVKILFMTVLNVLKKEGISSETSATMEVFMGTPEKEEVNV